MPLNHSMNKTDVSPSFRRGESYQWTGAGSSGPAQKPHTNPDLPRACWVTGARLSPPHTRARGSVDALPALGPTHGAPPPAQGENFLLSPQPGPDCRGQWVILSTSSSPGRLDRRPVSSSCDFSGCSFTRKRFLFYAEGLGIKPGRLGWWPWPPCLGHMLFPQTYLSVAQVLLCFSSCICSHLMKPEHPPKAETLPSTSLGSLPELAHGQGPSTRSGLDSAPRGHQPPHPLSGADSYRPHHPLARCLILRFSRRRHCRDTWREGSGH